MRLHPHPGTQRPLGVGRWDFVPDSQQYILAKMIEAINLTLDVSLIAKIKSIKVKTNSVDLDDCL